MVYSLGRYIVDSKDPQIPTYAKPIPEKQCDRADKSTGYNSNFYVPPALGRITKIDVQDDLTVNDISTEGVDHFLLGRDEFVQLTASMTALGKESSADRPNNVLIGKTIDEVQLDWSYNNDPIVSQVMTSNDGGIVIPLLAGGLRTLALSGLSITDDTQFTIAGDDGKSQAQANASVLFGNNMYWGPAPVLNNVNESALTSLLSGFSKEVVRDRVKTIQPTGGDTQYWTVLWPVRFGLGRFIFDTFEGGVLRIKKVGSVLKRFLEEGDSEADILITNEAGHTEAFYVYQTEWPGFDNAKFPFQIK
jgi:hypothetical protein